MFPSSEQIREIILIVEAKEESLITVQAFEEMIQFEQILYQVAEFSTTHIDGLGDVYRTGEGDVFTFEEICHQ